MAETEKPTLVEKPPIHKLKQTRLHLGESRIRWWFAVPEEGTPYEALFDPVYWDVHGFKFAHGDFIRVMPDEGHYTADLMVVGTGTGGVRVAEYFKKVWADSATASSEPLISQYRVKYAGPHHKWRVERIADNHVEQAHFENETAANQWLADNLRALSKVATKAA